MAERCGQFLFLRLSQERVYVAVDPDSAGWYRSETLELLIRPAPQQLDILDPSTGEPYLSSEEWVLLYEAAEKRAGDTEVEIVRLRSLL